MADWSLLTASEYILMPIHKSWTRQFRRINAQVPENGCNGKAEMRLLLILAALIITGCNEAPAEIQYLTLQQETDICEDKGGTMAEWDGPRIYDGTGETVDHFGNRWHHENKMDCFTPMGPDLSYGGYITTEPKTYGKGF
jgi:hypothetical protein